MYPVLVVEGKEYMELDLHYRKGKLLYIAVWDDDNKLISYYNKSAQNIPYVEKETLINFDECLKWKHRYDDVHKEIVENAKLRDSRMLELAVENIVNDLPFTPNKTQKEYFDLLNQQIGMMEAQEIVEEFMEEDVELEGAEC